MPKKRELRPRLQQFVDAPGDQVEALLVGQPADHPEQRPDRLRGRGQLQFLPQRRGALRLAPADRGGAIVRRQVGVGRGVPVRRVDPVQHAGEVVAAGRQRPLQAAPADGGADLLRVGRGDRGDFVGRGDARLEQIEPAVVFEPGVVEQPPVQPRQVHVPVGETALEGEVMNREHAAGGLEPRAAAVLFVQHRGDQAGLPVVGVDAVGAEGHHAAQFQHGAGEEREAFGVVRVVAGRVAVEVRAVEVVRPVDEQHADLGRRPVGGRAGVEDVPAAAGVDGFFAHPHGEPRAGQVRRRPPVLRLHLGVVRQDQGDLVPQHGQRLGERRRHVRQPAGLGVRHRLAAGQDETHGRGERRGVSPPGGGGSAAGAERRRTGRGRKPTARPRVCQRRPAPRGIRSGESTGPAVGVAPVASGRTARGWSPPFARPPPAAGCRPCPSAPAR